MKQVPIPRRWPLCLHFLWVVSRDVCMSARAPGGLRTSSCTVSGLFGTLSYRNTLGSNLWFLVCFMNSELNRKMSIYICWRYSMLRIGDFRPLTSVCDVACRIQSHSIHLSAGSWWTSKLSALHKLQVMFPAMQLLSIKKVSFFCLTLTPMKHTHFRVTIRDFVLFFSV